VHGLDLPDGFVRIKLVLVNGRESGVQGPGSRVQGS